MLLCYSAGNAVLNLVSCLHKGYLPQDVTELECGLDHRIIRVRVAWKRSVDGI